jgi:hypothetical protein
MSSSSSSSQMSGFMGRMVEMSDNGNGSSCWKSMAAIGELRGTSSTNVDGGDGGGHKLRMNCRCVSRQFFLQRNIHRDVISLQPLDY